MVTPTPVIVYSSSPRYYCGDGILQPGEQCDDGNNISGDGCSATCQREVIPYCGDGKLDAGEECDDGNTRNGDGCSQYCNHEVGECGNGRLETALGEQCDDGNRVNGDGCSADCKFERTPECGDGVVNPQTEQCDNGPANSYQPSACRPNCITPYCGDAIVDFNEECDDGNRLAGDGCNALCELEREAPTTPIVAGIITPNRPQMQPGIETVQQYPGQPVVINRVPPPARTPTGPGMVIFLASGAAAGAGFMRRKLKLSSK